MKIVVVDSVVGVVVDSTVVVDSDVVGAAV